MATGHSTQLTRQIGEHLVAAELGRRGFVATPFAGNVPDFDLLIADDQGRTTAAQVKAIRGVSWQFNASRFLHIDIVDGVQHVRGPVALVNPALLCVFVQVGQRAGDDVFYLFQQRDLQQIVAATYKGGVRPRNPNSLHCAIWPAHLGDYREAWHRVADALALSVT